MKDINLLLEEEKRMPQGEAPAAKPAKAAGKIVTTVLVAAMAITTLAGPKLYAASLEMRLESIKVEMKSEKYQGVESVKSQLAAAEQQLNGKIGILESIDKQAYPVNNIMTIVKNNTPEGCAVNNIEYDTKSLRLSVRASEIYNLAEFLLNMDRLEMIRLTENSNTIKMNPSGEYVFSFDVRQKEGE